jgi:hypothetical protein
MTSYATPAELRAVGLGGKIAITGPSSDANLQIALDAASDAINGICNRPDGFIALSVAVPRIYSGSGQAHQWIDECVSIALIEAKESPTDTAYIAWTATDWQAFSGDPKSPDFNSLPYTGLIIVPDSSYASFISGRFSRSATPTIRVTAKWGYAATCPPRVKQACIAQAARWVKRGEGAWNDALASAELGQMLYLKEIDLDIKMMLVNARLVRPAIGRR